MSENKEFSIDIRELNGRVLFSNFSNTDYVLFESTPKNKSNLKFATIDLEKYKVRVVAYSQDLISSNRLFKTTLKVIELTVANFILSLDKIEEDSRISQRRLVHNLITYNALTLQEIEVLIPQSQIAGKAWENKFNFVKKSLEQGSADAAEGLLKMAKYAQGIKAELSSFDKLYKKNPDLKLNKHDIYRVIMNTVYLFFPDFTDKGISIVVQNSNAAAVFDYESISVVLFHIFNNAAKYAIPGKKIDIYIGDYGYNVKIQISMLSVRIEDHEKKDIFREGYSGVHATNAKLSGSGIGMYIAKELIALNRGDIDVQIDRSNNERRNGLVYENNSFNISLPCTQ